MQPWTGVGASLTDFSGGVIATNPSVRTLLFDPTATKGAHLNLLRLPLSATDFSKTAWNWSWDGVRWVPPPEIKTAVAEVRAMLALQPKLRVVATSWTAPSDLKSDDPFGCHGGRLTPGSERRYAELLVRQATWLKNHGVPLAAMTVGNEPYHQVCNYPTLAIDNGQLAQVSSDAKPGLAALGVELWAHDHNWQHRGQLDTVLGSFHGRALPFASAAFHCYGTTEPDRMAGLPAALGSIITECTGSGDATETGGNGWVDSFAWHSEHLAFAPIRAGSSGVMMWNLALDRSDKRPTPMNCPNCRGLLDIKWQGAAPYANPEYYLLAHLARAADPDAGARRAWTSRISDVPAVGFVHADGSVGVFGRNTSGQEQTIAVRVLGATATRFVVKNNEMFTFRSPPGQPAPRSWSRGDIIISPDGYRYFVDDNATRHYIRDDAIFDCLGGWGVAVSNVPWSQIGQLPDGELAECLTSDAGDIIRHPVDGDSYVLDARDGGLVRHWIPSAADFACARAEDGGRAVVDVTRYQIEAIDAGDDRPDRTCIFRGPGGDAHFVNREGRREWIPDSPTWDCEIGKGVRVLDVSATFLTTVDEVGWHYCLHKPNLHNKVLRHHDGDSSYIHPDDTRTWIPDSPTWDCRQRQGVPVVDTRWREYVEAFRDTGWDYCFDAAVFRNKVLRHHDGDSHYIHPDDTKTWIPDVFTWGCRTNSGVPVVETRWRQYVDRFRGNEWDYCYDVNTMRNRIVSHPDGDSHYIDGAGVRHWIPSTTTYNCLVARGIPANQIRWRDYIARTPEGDWAICGDSIGSGQKLDRGQSLVSGDRRYRLEMQLDGNLVVYNSSGRAIWATSRFGQYAVVQGDGNFVEYARSGAAVWASNTVSSGGNRLVMQSDGNLVLYSPSRAVWASNTVGR